MSYGNGVKSFTINDIARFTGLKAHIIRTWENRYGIFNPQRNPGNFRQYTLCDLQKIMTISLLKRNGFKISHLALMSDVERELRVNKLKNDDEILEITINKLLMFMYGLDADGFETSLDNCFLHSGFETSLKKLIFPFLSKAELLWQGHHLKEEHPVVTIIRKKIMAAIDNTAKPAITNKTVLLFLPDQSQLDLVLLSAHYQLKLKGVKVLYMGNDISQSNLEAYLHSSDIHFIYTYLPQKNNFKFSEISDRLKEIQPGVKLVISTYPSISLNNQFENVIPLEYDDAINFLSA